MKISSRFKHHKIVGKKFSEPSMTHQSFKNECDVNTIMDRYRRTGVLVDPSVQTSRSPLFGDFTNVPDFHKAQEIIIESENLFMSLPSHVREAFNHSPGDFMDFCSDPANRDELIDLGLVIPDEEPSPEPVSAGGKPDGRADDSGDSTVTT